MTQVLLGNVGALNSDGSSAGIGNTVTMAGMREDFDDRSVVEMACSTDNDPVLNVIRHVLHSEDLQYAIGVLEVNDLWSTAHSSDPPEWIESDDPEFARVLAFWFSRDSHEYGRELDLLGIVSSNVATAQALSAWIASRDHDCAVGRPEEWFSASDLPPLGGGAFGTEFQPEEFSIDFWTRWRVHELLTNAGRDALHQQHTGGAGGVAQPAQFQYMATSTSAAAEVATNTTLPGEIVTAGSGFLRAQATWAHTVGTNTTTLTKTFTATGTDASPTAVSKIGILNAAAAGTLGYEKNLAAAATTNTAGDNVAITWTNTGG